MSIEQLHRLFLKASQACTDSRNIPQNAMFFALKGANFNGNAFAVEAIQQGAMYAVADEEEFAGPEAVILVDNVLETLQQLANYHRHYCKARIIALTGSNGKTTTKELIKAVLSRKYRTIATQGNLNNHIGVPLTLLSIKEDTELAIVEMGANHKKEIGFLCGIAEPDYGYITNFGKAHLEGFGGIDGVIEGKSELYDYLMNAKKYIFFNADDPVQLQRIGNYAVSIGFSAQGKTGLPVRFLGASPFVSLQYEGLDIQTRLMGSYNFSNCAVAALAGHYFEVPAKDIKDALEEYTPSNNRSQLIEKNAYRILLDAYNANPTSMKAALENFKSIERGYKIAFLGDMFELGEAAAGEHQAIADLANKINLNQVYLIGENFSEVDSPFPKFGSYKQFETFIKNNPPKPANILIKGSRGMALERILEWL
jgi:UDP-N-acetylmuramoyl-tripeptide--D-alanyl-D-alanine ligase